MTRTSAEEEYLNCLFTILNTRKIRFAVMRNHEGLPKTTNGSDLDILVDPGNERAVEAALREAVSEAGGVVIGVSRSAGFFKLNAFGITSDSNYRWWGLRTDVSAGFQFKGWANLLNQDILSADLPRYHSIPILPTYLASVIGVLKEVLYNDLIPDSYLPDAIKAFARERNQLSRDLSPFGLNAFEILAQICSDTPNVVEQTILTRKLRNAVSWHAFFTSPILSIIRRVRFESARVSRLFSPPGKVIRIITRNSSDLKAVITGISPVLEKATHGDFVTKDCSRAKGLIYEFFTYWLKTRLFIARSPAILCETIVNKNLPQTSTQRPSIRKLLTSLIIPSPTLTIFFEPDFSIENGQNRIFWEDSNIVRIRYAEGGETLSNAALVAIQTICAAE